MNDVILRRPLGWKGKDGADFVGHVGRVFIGIHSLVDIDARELHGGGSGLSHIEHPNTYVYGPTKMRPSNMVLQSEGFNLKRTVPVPISKILSDGLTLVGITSSDPLHVFLTNSCCSESLQVAVKFNN